MHYHEKLEDSLTKHDVSGDWRLCIQRIAARRRRSPHRTCRLPCLGHWAADQGDVIKQFLLQDPLVPGHEHRIMLLSPHANQHGIGSSSVRRHHTLLQPPCVIRRSRCFTGAPQRLSSSDCCPNRRLSRPDCFALGGQPHQRCRQHGAAERGGSHVLHAARSAASGRADGDAGQAGQGGQEKALSPWASLVSRFSAARLAAIPQTSALTNPKFMPMVVLCVPPCPSPFAPGLTRSPAVPCRA